jgi:hypothetical protein
MDVWFDVTAAAVAIALTIPAASVIDIAVKDVAASAAITTALRNWCGKIFYQLLRPGSATG